MPDNVADYILAENGPDVLAALQRACGPYNDVGYRMGAPADPERTRLRAWACWDAEDTAIGVLKGLRDWCDDEIKAITEPGEPQDERMSYVSGWRGADDVIIALAKLADARNDARPAR